MTKKRHAKLMRALATKVHEYGKKTRGESWTSKDMYKCVKLAEQGLIPEIPGKPNSTRLDFWKSIPDCLKAFGMDNIKEVRS